MAINKLVHGRWMIESLDDPTDICRHGLMIKEEVSIEAFAEGEEVAPGDVKAIIKAPEGAEAIAVDTSKNKPKRNKKSNEKDTPILHTLILPNILAHLAACLFGFEPVEISSGALGLNDRKLLDSSLLLLLFG